MRSVYYDEEPIRLFSLQDGQPNRAETFKRIKESYYTQNFFEKIGEFESLLKRYNLQPFEPEESELNGKEARLVGSMQLVNSVKVAAMVGADDQDLSYIMAGYDSMGERQIVLRAPSWEVACELAGVWLGAQVELGQQAMIRRLYPDLPQD